MPLTIVGELDEESKEFLLNSWSAQAAKAQLGSVLKNSAYNVKYHATHTWAGGAALTDTHTVGVTGMVVETTDILMVLPLDSTLATSCRATRVNDSDILLTNVGNGANGELYQVLVLHPVS